MIEAIIATMQNRYGYNLHGYSQPLLCSKIQEFIEEENSHDLNTLIDRVAQDHSTADRLIIKLTNGTTNFFRDPSTLLAMSYLALPLLKQVPYTTIWHVGCSSGEEVYSMIILLLEANMLGKVRIIGTDINKERLQTAKNGIYPHASIASAEKDYRRAGGKKQLADYFSLVNGYYHIDNQLKNSTSFFMHDVMNDGPIGEVHLVFCRNVFIYFTNDAIKKAGETVAEKLQIPAVVCLGKYEPIYDIWQEMGFVPLSTQERIYSR